MIIPEPATMEEKVSRLWYAVLGSNGDGISSKVNKITGELEEVDKKIDNFEKWFKEKFDRIEALLEDHLKKEEVKEEVEEKVKELKTKERRRTTPFQVLTLIIGCVGALGTIALAIVSLVK